MPKRAASADHFSAFLDVLVEELAHPGPIDPAVDVAGRIHLSRFHFDRVILAVAGESPTVFRARILLERAAYRLITTDRPVIDVAGDAGFGSQAAFSRAFKRAHGMPPATWRRRPRSFRIAAPSDVHFHPPGGLRLPARHRMDSMDLVTEMVEHHAWVVGQLIERAARLSDAELDAPLPGSLDLVDGNSLRWVLARLVGQMAMWNAAVADAEYDFGVEAGESVSSMRRRWADEVPVFRANVERFAGEGRFDETFVNAFDPRPTVLTHGAMVSHVLTFAAHHRLLALARLHELGITDLGLGDPKAWPGVGAQQ